MSFSARTTLGGLLALFATCSTSLFAQLKADVDPKPHRDPIVGYSIRPLYKFEASPPQPDEVYELVTFRGGSLSAPGSYFGYSLSMRILKFERAKPATPDPGEEPPTGKPDDPQQRAKELLKRWREQNRARDFVSYVEASRLPDLKWIKKGEKLRLGKHEALEYEYTHLASRRDKVKILDHCWAVVFALDEFDIAVDYSIPDIREAFKKWAPALRKSARTFELIKRMKVEESAAEMDRTEKRKADLRKEIAKFPEWRLEETPHYLVMIHNDDADFVREILHRIEAIRKIYEKECPPSKEHPITAKSVLRVCKNRDEYVQYSGIPGSAGYWSRGTEELVIYDAKDVDRNYTWGVLNHEAFHQYIYYRCNEADPHDWFNEGTAEYYYGYEYKRGRFKLEKNGVRLPTVIEALRKARDGEPWPTREVKDKQTGKEKPLSPLEDLITARRREYYGRPHLYYAIGWSLVWYLREGQRSRAYQKSWSKILPTYVEVLTETGDREKANERAFEGVDLDELQKAWLAYDW